MGTRFRRTVPLALAALLTSCAASPRAEPAPAPSGPAPWIAVGTPLGDEPEGWEDLRGVPFELHLVGPDPDLPWGWPPSALLELRPGGQVEPGPDGERCLPRRLFRDQVVGFSNLPVTFGSGAEGHLVVPYRGWAAAVLLHLRPDDTQERSIREATLDIVLVRVLAEEVHKATIEAGGVLDPAPAPLGGVLQAEKAEIVHDVQVRRRRRSDPEPSNPVEPSPFDTNMDLVEARDSKGRRVSWTGSSLGGGSMTSTFTVEGEPGAAIAYPVHLRVRNPLRWSRRTYRFVLRDLPLPE